jgi:hypothetical protein
LPNRETEREREEADELLVPKSWNPSEVRCATEDVRVLFWTIKEWATGHVLQKLPPSSRGALMPEKERSAKLPFCLASLEVLQAGKI